MHPDMRAHQHPWHAYRANLRNMPYRRFYGRGFPSCPTRHFRSRLLFHRQIRGADVGSLHPGSNIDGICSDELRREELKQQQQPQQPAAQPVRCIDCNNKIESARDSKL
ncbi:hypothetical protein PG991_015516 [Apiospora marii]|uniref:Uncharacterized protein n=1 Tax=Apiospora marii TaxID=335849 RepID=A0ABR1R2K2_9PEZI